MLDELKASERTRTIPVLLVSGFASPVSPQHSAQAAAVIQKPFLIADRLAQVERALG